MCQQNTAEWLQWRCGRIGASRVADVIAKRKNGKEEMACRRDYRMELLCERLTGRTADHYVSPDMDRGSQLEPYARAAYEVATGAMVDLAGFILHPTMDFSGASPDGLLDSDGGLELKAPRTSTHLEWMMAGVVPEEHQAQLLWNMACAERSYWDFLSFDDRLPEGLRIFVARMERDEKRIAEMEYSVMEFNAEIEQMCKSLGAPPWIPKVPARFGDQGTERIGEMDVPSDLAEMLDGSEIVP
jgi:putative phage-type endonuclease